ncbi:MAG: hypothetical protein OEY52_04080 [Gammaproteobacteria bacterium]|nr:hypothetical protein [Gammaproteobacteria bacterium]
MLSSKSATAPVLNLKPSRYFAIYIALGHALGLLVLFYPTNIPITVRILIAMAILISFIYHWQTREPVKAVRALWDDNLWLLQLKDGSEVKAQLHGEYTVTSWLIVLCFRIADERKKYTVVIFSDSGEADEIRKMRVFLRQL